MNAEMGGNFGGSASAYSRVQQKAFCRHQHKIRDAKYCNTTTNLALILKTVEASGRVSKKATKL